ncbi:MAG: 4'-phosphopantetheinyl transferase superfamily protein [Amaricoccus sp.]|uniref:4'-phosphopantetheinyl transferase family protein n=1 Tax=Amaricoccus sp. TaxID=1872485 RepID=UPI0033160D60
MIPRSVNVAARLDAAARDIFPEGLGVAVLDPRVFYAGLAPDEAAALAGTVPRRAREFTAGRVAARRAMREIGFLDRSVPAGVDRAPIWPDGLVGSIAHSAERCVAVVAPAADWSSLGVDIEPDAPLEETLWDSVLRPEELAWLDARPAGDRARLARLIFSAKECAYKCQYPLTRALLDFDDFSIAIEAGAFHARFQRPVSPFGQGAALSGRWTAAEGALLTALALRP